MSFMRVGYWSLFRFFLLSTLVMIVLVLLSGLAVGRDSTTRFMVLALDPSVGRELPQFGADLAVADSVVDLGQDADFAWDVLEYETADRNLYQDRFMKMMPGVSGDWEIGQSGRRILLFRVDFASLLPTGCTVRKAELHLETSGTWYTSWADTFCATLMTNPADSLWYRSLGATGLTTEASFFGHASWANQIEGLGDGGFPSTSEGPWSPPLDDRHQYWDWGEYADWSAHNEATYVAYQEVRIDLTNCVQGVVNGEVNNGIMVMATEKNDLSGFLSSFHWEAAAGDSLRRPWLTIEYDTSPYEAPFPNGRDWAFVFSTDDGKLAANAAYADIFNAHGEGYSIFVVQDWVGKPGNADWADLVHFRNQGMEIGSHSRWHNPADVHGRGGLCRYGCLYSSAAMDIRTYVRGGDPDIYLNEASTAWDSLLADTDPVWLYDGSESVDGLRREDDPMWGKAFALPQNQWDVWTLQAMRYHNYVTMRCGSAYLQRWLPDMTGDHYVIASFRPDLADSLRIGFTPHAPRQPWNMIGVPVSHEIAHLVGSIDDTEISREQVTFNVRKTLEQQRASHRRVLAVFTHDFKTNPTGPDYSQGMDPEELEWILDAVEEADGAIMTVGEYSRWMKSRSWATGTPVDYLQPENFRYDPGDSVWFSPAPVDFSDVTEPVLVSVRPVDKLPCHGVELGFSEPVAQWAVCDARNFRINGYTVISSVRDPMNTTVVRLELDRDLESNGLGNEVSCAGVLDLAGNQVPVDGVANAGSLLVKNLVVRAHATGIAGQTSYSSPGPLNIIWGRNGPASCQRRFRLTRLPSSLDWEGEGMIWDSWVGEDNTSHVITWRFMVDDCVKEPLAADRVYDMGASGADRDTIDAWWGESLAHWSKSAPVRSGLSVSCSPNPSNGGVIVSYSLPEADLVIISVHDLVGRRLATLVSGSMPVGDHAVVWRGRDEQGFPVASGLYFIRFQTGSSTRVRRITMLK